MASSSTRSVAPLEMAPDLAVACTGPPLMSTGVIGYKMPDRY